MTVNATDSAFILGAIYYFLVHVLKLLGKAVIKRSEQYNYFSGMFNESVYFYAQESEGSLDLAKLSRPR
jgi:hypothetical protein